jgi:hypothetical protein
MVENVHALTTRSWTWQGTTELVGKLNRTIRGWANYFEVGAVSKAYRVIDNYTAVRLRWWLHIKHKTRRRKGGTYPLSHLYGHFGLVRRASYYGVYWVSGAPEEIRTPDPQIRRLMGDVILWRPWRVLGDDSVTAEQRIIRWRIHCSAEGDGLQADFHPGSLSARIPSL